MKSKAVTLIELLISLALLSVIILAATSFNVTSSTMLQSSEKKTAVLNDLTYAVEVIQKNALNATGYVGSYGIYPNPGNPAGSYNIVWFQFQPGGNLNAYYLTGKNLTYCDDYNNSTSSCINPSPAILSRRVTGFTVTNPGSVQPFFLDLALTGQYNVTESVNNSTNPQVIINTTIFPGQQSLS